MSKIFLPIVSNGMNLVRANFASCLLAGFTRREMTTANISYPYPCGAMNIASNIFLKTDCDFMFIVDGDLCFTRQDVDNLLDHDLPLVFGYYCKRKPGIELAVESFDGKPPVQDGKFWKVKSAARGFMAMKKEALESMKHDSPLFDCSAVGGKAHAFWRTKLGGHSEDFEFCERWRALGNDVLVDPRVFVTHMGDCAFPLESERKEMEDAQ